MPRRRSGLQPLHLAGAVAFLAIAGGAYWLLARDKTERLAGAPFSAQDYARNQIVRGNTYVVTGTIVRQLRFSGDSSRLFSMEVRDEGSSEALPVPVLVPANFRDMNIQVGQEFQMSVIVEIDGVLRAREIRKS
jgi:hypothetical protein